MDIAFDTIRPLLNSRGKAFEELCCQLAEMERDREPSLLAGARFYRKAGEGGDAGIEGYYVLPDGREWGWQAKYFFKLGKKQWEQIDQSVMTALEKHSRLVRYTVCLPIDLSDGRKGKELSQRQNWDIRVAKWKRWATEKVREVEFCYWGAFELRKLLTESAHKRAGHIQYWFDEKFLSTDWFETRLAEVIKDAGPRYTPEIHVELPISRYFDSFGRTETFVQRIESFCSNLLRMWKRAKPWPLLLEKFPAVEEPTERITRHVENLAAVLKESAANRFDHVNFKQMETLAKALSDAAAECLEWVEKGVSKDGDASQRSSASGRYVPSTSELVSALGHGVRTLEQCAADVIEFTRDHSAMATNHCALLLTGEAGSGKTHLFCDIAKKRMEQGLPTVLLLGQKFTSARDPWAQIIEQLHLGNIAVDHFLSALEAASQIAGRRALILIDALNEGEGIDLWEKHLRGMRQLLTSYLRVVMAVSCRDTYERAIIPSEMIENGELMRVRHQGFEGEEYDATKIFFEHFGIESPAGPLLVPEFSNPLFLKLLCGGLQNMGVTKIPKGFRGITAIFEFFIKSVNHKLSKQLGYDEDENSVKAAVDVLVNRMAETGTAWLEKGEAKQIVAGIRSEALGIPYEKTFFRNLIHEGLLMEDLQWESHDDGSTRRVLVVRFGYERLTNHLLVSLWLGGSSDVESFTSACETNEILRRLVTDPVFARRNAGWIYGLSTQLPERAGCELVEAFPDIMAWPMAQQAFLSSLISRDPSRTTQTTRDFLNHMWRTGRYNDSVYNVILMVSCDPEHVFNALSLHRHLSKFGMGDRDAVWSVYLHQNYGDGGPIDRLIDWAWDADTTQAEDDVAELCATALTWFLTSSHRFLRDRAAKALVALLKSRVKVLPRVIDRFKEVDDPYVLERLYAVAYGVSMISDDDQAVSELSAKVYQWVFQDGSPPAHLLLRDYARGVIEVSNQRNVLPPNINLAHVRPPYRSTWPLSMPEEESLNKLGQHPEKDNDAAWPMVWLYHSIMGDSDWLIYIMRPACEKFSYVRPSALAVSDMDEKKKKNKVPFWDAFDPRIGQRWIMNRVLELGWTTERFGDFDKHIARFYYYGRGETSKPERMGKKYCWIALHEFLGYLADSVKMGERSWGLFSEQYCGPWQLFRRDLDPSVLLHETRGTDEPELVRAWWQPIDYTFDVRDEEGHEAWIKDFDDIVDPVKLMDVRDSEGKEWLTLEGYYDWTELPPVGEDKYESPRRTTWLQIRSYVVKASQAEKMTKWLKRQDLWGRWMPEHSDIYHVFLGEYPWAPAFDKQYALDDPWTKEGRGRLPHPVIVTTAHYHWERGYDCSMNQHSMLAILPSAWLVQNMGLSWSRCGFSFVDSQSDRVILDPSAEQAGPNALLVSKPRMARFLSDNNLALLWTVLGERSQANLYGDQSKLKGRTTIQGVYRLAENEVQGGRPRAKYEG